MENIFELLEQLAMNEDKIMELYWAYAEGLPQQKELWNRLADEEKTHASMIRGLTGLLDGKNLSAAHQIPMLDEVQSSIGYIEKEIKIAKKKELTSAYALKTALKIEKSILDSSSFSIFVPKDQKLKELFSNLRDDTARHFKLLSSQK